MEIVLAVLLVVIAFELYLILNQLERIWNLLKDIWGGLIGNGYGALSKLSYLEYINSKLDKIEEKTPKR